MRRRGPLRRAEELDQVVLTFFHEETESIKQEGKNEKVTGRKDRSSSPTPVLVVGTYDKEGRPNAMTAAWGGICCSRPPCLAIALRKATYTYGNVVARKAFTINIPSARQAAEVDYFGMVSGKERDKFAMTGLTA